MNTQTPTVITTVGKNDEIWMQLVHVRLHEVFFVVINDKLSSAAPALTGKVNSCRSLQRKVGMFFCPGQVKDLVFVLC